MKGSADTVSESHTICSVEQCKDVHIKCIITVRIIADIEQNHELLKIFSQRYTSGETTLSPIYHFPLCTTPSRLTITCLLARVTATLMRLLSAKKPTCRCVLDLPCPKYRSTHTQIHVQKDVVTGF